MAGFFDRLLDHLFGRTASSITAQPASHREFHWGNYRCEQMVAGPHREVKHGTQADGAAHFAVVRDGELMYVCERHRLASDRTVADYRPAKP